MIKIPAYFSSHLIGVFRSPGKAPFLRDRRAASAGLAGRARALYVSKEALHVGLQKETPGGGAVGRFAATGESLEEALKLLRHRARTRTLKERLNRSSCRVPHKRGCSTPGEAPTAKAEPATGEGSRGAPDRAANRSARPGAKEPLAYATSDYFPHACARGA